MKKWFKQIVLCGSVLVLCGCGFQAKETAQTETETETVDTGAGSSIQKEEAGEISDYKLRDKELLYASDDETSVVTMYLTVRRGNTSEGTNHSWEEINTYSAYDYDEMGVDRYQVEALLQVGDENGPVQGEVGYDTNVPNATVQIRGQTSSRNAQKNYKVRLKDNKGLWRGQQTINLNKHQTDGMRFRNKLGFDLLKGIPQTMSLRTQFVHLYVKDETDGQVGDFQDYGLYTQVEQLNKKGMRAHGLDTNGHLYKINFFEFFRYEDVIKPVDDPTYDEKAFEAMLECKGNSDHTKLIRLLEDINNYDISVSELIEKHFDIENLTYWMAFHILTGNVDTQSRNFYIYSPQNSEKWYIISWDNDALLRRTENALKGRSDAEGWEKGISNYWGNMLFQRMLKSEAFREKLDEAILDLKEYLSSERLSGMIEEYRTVTDDYIGKMPDEYYAPLTPQEYEAVAKKIPEEIELNYQHYLESLENPLPFFIGVPEIVDGKLMLQWDISYDFQKDDVIYTAKLSKNYDMSDVIMTYEGMWPEIETDLLPAGQYFLQVKSRDTAGNEQFAFDHYITENGKVYGILCFYVLPDGSIVGDTYEE